MKEGSAAVITLDRRLNRQLKNLSVYDNSTIMSDASWVVKNGDLQELKTLLEKDQSILTAEVKNRPLLCHAADYGQKDIIEYLLSKGANVNATDKYGITALLAAVYEGHQNCVEILLKHGANKTGKTPDGQSYYDAAESQAIKDLLK